MIFTRIGDDVAVGIGSTLFFRKGDTVDTAEIEYPEGLTELELVTLFTADTEWVEGVPAVEEPPSGEAPAVTSESDTD